MNDVQSRIEELKDKGWTLTAIGDEVGVTRRAMGYWQPGTHYPGNSKAVLALLDSLLKRKRIPKKRRYAKGSRAKES